MKSVKLSQDNTTAAVQPGARWIDVYNALDAVGYAIPGGRAGDVGVGGLTTGGVFHSALKRTYVPLGLLEKGAILSSQRDMDLSVITSRTSKSF